MPGGDGLPAPYYDDGQGVVLYHGDALEVLPVLRGGSVDLVVTDPPYVIGAQSAYKMRDKAGGWGDMMNSARWFRDWYALVRRLLTPRGALWTFCNWRSLPVVMRAAADAGCAVTSVLVWDKCWIGPGGEQGLRPSYELVALLAMPDFAIPNRGLPDIWQVPWSSHKPNGHPAEKPLALMTRLILVSGLSAGALVLDPFAGSGTTLRAAKNLGLRAAGIETEARYCAIAADRLGQLVLPLDLDPASKEAVRR